MGYYKYPLAGQDLEDLQNDLLDYELYRIFGQYQQWVLSMWNHGEWTPQKLKAFPAHRDDMIMTAGLPGEVGEVMELVKKLNRDDTNNETFRKKLVLELGDVLYYINMIAARYDISMNEVVTGNIKKLTRRYKLKAKKAKS